MKRESRPFFRKPTNEKEQNERIMQEEKSAWTQGQASVSEKQGFDNRSEERFGEWLNHHEYAWHYINQALSTFPVVYQDIVKRPDFEVQTPWGEGIAVDVKARRIYPFSGNGSFALDEEQEVQKYINLERIWGKDVWIVFVVDGSDYDEFYWISLKTILSEVGPQVSSVSGELFRPIPINLCKKLTWDDNLYKLLKFN